MNHFADWIVAMIATVFPGIGGPETPVYNGYVEADFVHVAPSAPGRIEMIAVQEGDQIEAGQLLFRLDDTHQQAALRAAQARVDVARAELENLKTGSRAAEVEVIRAELQQALAEQSLARATLTRSIRLAEQGLVPAAKVDADQAAAEQANAHVAQLQARLQVAELPARDAQVVAAEAALAAARAEADRARLDLEDRRVTAPIAGLVEHRLFQEGEVTATGTPVVSILPPNRRSALFFVPEPQRADFAIGEVLALSCDGCPPGLHATVTRIASDPQYTPPIIYSRAQRARLVFRAEAAISDGSGLMPGQPVTLRRPE